jgi:quinol monooxygenase YgiN
MKTTMTKKRSPTAKVMTAILTPRPGHGAELLQMLEGLRTAIGGSKGCLECLVARDVSGQRYVLLSSWTDARSLDAHLQSEHFGILRGAADVLGTQTDLRFFAGDEAVGS